MADVLTEPEIRAVVGLDAARECVRDAFVALAEGRAILPPPIGFQFPATGGEMHVKGAHLEGFATYTVKMATGFPANREAGLPVMSGLMVVFDAATGFVQAILLDNGYLTEVRTAAAGALAAEALSRVDASTVAVLGAGGQARHQLEALVRVRPIERVRAWSRTQERTEAYAGDVGRMGLDAEVCPSARDAVAGADIVLTVTPAKRPIVEAGWLSPGTCVVAVGSDFEDKQELDAEVVGRADKYVADSIAQCLRYGELHHAVDAGAMTVERVHGELGQVLSGRVPGRETEEEITVADLTGLGIQDAAIADLVVRAAGAAPGGG